MRINFYDARIDKDNRTMLVKEKAVNYDVGKTCSPKEVVQMMRQLIDMEHLAEEHCYMIAFNGAGRVLGMFFISKGSALQTLVNPREVFLRALLVGETHIILCHNHPGGETHPSKSDNLLTQKFKKAGELLGIPLLDHIIIGKADNGEECYFSFLQEGFL